MRRAENSAQFIFEFYLLKIEAVKLVDYWLKIEPVKHGAINCLARNHRLNFEPVAIPVKL
ncbi:hypothetical protein THS27_25815 [Thalassospira sp. MCCC 1A01428]|nr:hypothetical protein THS27_25815 [Thalassospira sp. MCCC 1A01428]